MPRALQVRVLYFVGRALLKDDRPTFALHLVHGMHPDLFQPVSAIPESTSRGEVEGRFRDDSAIDTVVRGWNDGGGWCNR